jgi:hypothetical protein
MLHHAPKEGNLCIRAQELAHQARLLRKRAAGVARDAERVLAALDELNGRLLRFEIRDDVLAERVREATGGLVAAVAGLDEHCEASAESVEMEVVGEVPAEMRGGSHV